MQARGYYTSLPLVAKRFDAALIKRDVWIWNIVIIMVGRDNIVSHAGLTKFHHSENLCVRSGRISWFCSEGPHA